MTDGLGGKLDSDDRKELLDAIKETADWIDSEGQSASADDLEEKLQEIQNIANPITAKLYIAVEFAGVFNSLGTEAHLLIHGDRVLRTFDPAIQETLTPWMEHTGIKLHRKTKVTRVKGQSGNLTAHTDKGKNIEADVLLWAIGHQVNTKNPGLKTVGIKTAPKGDSRRVPELQRSRYDFASETLLASAS